uniref:GDSL esterase/lipase EXL3-like n=1 Tax=Erigeron canadensis TaxID=72917 RepID=UPI001CB8C441|nr:GDSL esterase/lipase EXL3-like [Erigeron canadensis]
MMKVIFFCLYVSLCIHCSKGNLNIPKKVAVSAVIAFGDSVLDQGNNNYFTSVIKANFPPCGRDFSGGIPTGRFCNGKTLADVFAARFGVKEYLPAYLDPHIQDKDLQTGVSFASGGSGYDPLTPIITSSIPLSVQLGFFKQYIGRLKKNIGEEAANATITNSMFLVSSSSNDFLSNYFTVSTRRLHYDVPAYVNMLVDLAVTFVQEIQKLGARKIAVLGAPPLGCTPIGRTIGAGVQRSCVDKFNKAAELFNNMLKQQLQLLSTSLPQSRVAFIDLYTPFINIVKNPQQYGLEVTERGCCGSGTIEYSFLCNKLIPSCFNDSKFLYWDSIHLTEIGYSIYADHVLPDLVKNLF